MTTAYEFTRVGLGYCCDWQSPPVRLFVERIHRSRDGVKAELVVRGTAAPFPEHITGPVIFNLSSATTRSSMAKYLGERTDDLPVQVDWKGLLEVLCTLTLEAVREGQPLQWAGQLPQSTGPRWLIDRFLPEGMVTSLYGPGGGCKSLTAALAAVCVSTGLPFLGLDPARRGKVLYCDYDATLDELDARVKLLSAGLHVTAPEIAYRTCAGPFHEQIEDVARIVSEHEIILGVVDSAGRALAGAAADGADANAGITRLYDALRYVPITCC